MDNLFLPIRITEKLSQIHDASLTIVEAPAGYGKTTAVRWEMEKLPSRQIYWYTAVSFFQDTSIDWMFHQIGKRNPEAGASLKALGFLNRSNAYAAAEILSNMQIREPLYLIFDNFQIIRQNWPPILLQALADRRVDGLHVIVLSQNFGQLRIVYEHAPGVVRFHARDFLLNRQEIAQYSIRQGQKLTDRQIERIFINTEGWAAAVWLYLNQLQKSSHSLQEFQDMDSLLGSFFWSRLTREDQLLMLRVAVFECIQEEHLTQVAPGQELELYNVLVRAPLIHRDSKTRTGYPHELLRSFLTRRLLEEPADFRSQVYERTGEICRRMSNFPKAVMLFFQAGNDEKLLQCDLTGLTGESFGGIGYPELAHRVLLRCSDQLIARYPVSALQLCMALFSGGDFHGFQQAMEKTGQIIRQLKDSQLLGEWYLAAAFLEFPHIPKMKTYYIRAAEIMTAPSRIFTIREPFLFGSTSVWYLFHRTPGKMMETGEQLREMLELYNSLTCRHGAGAYELYLCEALTVQGHFEEAEMAARRAAVLSEQWQNASVTYGAARMMGVLALYQADTEGLQKAVDYLENHACAYPFLQQTAVHEQMTATVRSYLLGLMMEPNCVGVQPADAEGGADCLTFSRLVKQMNSITALVLHQKYKQAIAAMEIQLQQGSTGLPLVARNYMYVGLCLCNLAIGSTEFAAEWLERSLSLTEPDGSFSFLASLRGYLRKLFLLPEIRNSFGQSIEKISVLSIHYTKAEERQIFSILEQSGCPGDALTEREQQVAQLVAQGLHNKEIAVRLCISQETVKSHIRSIFTKFNIDRRSKLVELLK